MQPSRLLPCLLLTLSLTAQTPPCDAANDSNTTINTNAFTGFGFAGPGHYAHQYTPTAPLAAQAMTIVTNQYSGATRTSFMSLEIWDDNAGTPGTRLAGGTWQADFGVANPYWQGANLDRPVFLQPSTPYWLVWVEPGGCYLPHEPAGAVTFPVMYRAGNGAWATRAAAALKFRLYCNLLDDANIAVQGFGCSSSAANYGSLYTTRAATIGNSRFLLEGGGLPPNSLSLMVLGVDGNFASTPVPGLPGGCQQHTDLFTTLGSGITGTGNVRAAAAFGHVVYPMPVPANAALIGLFLAAQIAALDPGSSAPIPFVTTNALRIVLN